ncbi:MAG: hypothetical protein NZ805_11715 [Armatimonadetes bacterium]|nr:hypothetical protein [Armatimonadota bacterium]MDW8029990.1 hypothetical protein [Armatimonadota bacterium]
MKKFFEECDDFIVWRKFTSRHLQTIDKFLFNETGGLAGIVQIGFDPNGRYRGVEIPIDKFNFHLAEGIWQPLQSFGSKGYLHALVFERFNLQVASNCA